MSAAGTTSIDALPETSGGTDPVQLVTQDTGNEVLSTPPVYTPSVEGGGRTVPPARAPLDPTQLAKTLNQPSMNAMTRFPEGDIAMSTAPHQIDGVNRADYVPDQTKSDYIGSHEVMRPIQRNQSETKDSFRIPILAATCFFLFQNKYFKRIVQKVLPSPTLAAGGLDTQGQLVLSGVFGLVVYGGMELLENLEM